MKAATLAAASAAIFTAGLWKSSTAPLQATGPRQRAAAFTSIRPNTPIVNCILWGNTDAQGGIESSQIGGHFFKPADLVIHHTCVQGWTGRYTGIGNIGDDPLFADAEGGDFHPLTGSPCVDAGDSSAMQAGAMDLDGSVRIMGAAVDIGAMRPCRPW